MVMWEERLPHARPVWTLRYRKSALSTTEVQTGRVNKWPRQYVRQLEAFLRRAPQAPIRFLLRIEGAGFRLGGLKPIRHRGLVTRCVDLAIACLEAAQIGEDPSQIVFEGIDFGWCEAGVGNSAHLVRNLRVLVEHQSRPIGELDVGDASVRG